MSDTDDNDDYLEERNSGRNSRYDLDNDEYKYDSQELKNDMERAIRNSMTNTTERFTHFCIWYNLCMQYCINDRIIHFWAEYTTSF